MLVLKNAGPLTPAGMPEAGYLPIPTKLARAGVKDMVRISDCRMSGTAFGTIVLHVTPGGRRRRAARRWRRPATASGSRCATAGIDLLVAEDELARRRAAWSAPAKPDARLGPARRRPGPAGRRGLRPGRPPPLIAIWPIRLTSPVHVIGASGRSGAALCRALLADGVRVVPVVRDRGALGGHAPALEPGASPT